MGAALRFPDVQRPYFDPDSILSFTQMPDPIWTDPNVSDLAVRVHGFLVCWLRLHPGRFPDARDVARALDRADCTVRRAIKMLASAGYLILGKRRAESRYNAKMGYQLKTPKPTLTSQPRPNPQGHLFPEEDDSRADVRAASRSPAHPGAHVCAPNTNTEREKTDRPAGTREEVGPSILSLPEKTCSSEVTDDEHEREIARRAGELLDGVTPAAVADVVKRFGLLAVDQAVEVAERRNPSPEHWRFVVVTLENWERESKLPMAEAPAKMQNYNPASEIKPLTPADINLPEALEQVRGGGTAAFFAAGLIRGWLAKGVISAADVPSDLVLPEAGKAGRGLGRQTLPPAGWRSRPDSVQLYREQKSAEK